MTESSIPLSRAKVTKMTDIIAQEAKQFEMKPRLFIWY
jgi:hypothetical protein